MCMCAHTHVDMCTHIHVLTMLSTNSTNEIHPLPAVTFKKAIFSFVLVCVCLLHPCVEARKQPQLSLLKTYLPYFWDTGLELAQQAGLASQPTSPRDAPISASLSWNDEHTPQHSFFFWNTSFYNQAQVLKLPKQALKWDSSLVHLFLHVLIFTLSTAII